MKINDYTELIRRIFSIRQPEDFETLALELFRIHYQENPVYREYCHLLSTHFRAEKISKYSEIPFLPIDLFKTHSIHLSSRKMIDYFVSSGTGSGIQSKHYISDFTPYQESLKRGFENFWGPISDYCFLSLLPNYIEQKHSSLIYMVDSLCKLSAHPDNGFYLYNHQELYDTLLRLEAKGQKTILFGVTYALLDFAETYAIPLQHTQIIETGGMKGRKKEILRNELHQILSNAFQTRNIYSEYGMTELFSQAYLNQNSHFECPPWMKILIRKTNDPFSYEKNEKVGGINVIDLANIYSCPFIETQDLGKLYADQSFEVLGRFDKSDIRGCSLLSI